MHWHLRVPHVSQHACCQPLVGMQQIRCCQFVKFLERVPIQVGHGQGYAVHDCQTLLLLVQHEACRQSKLPVHCMEVDQSTTQFLAVRVG